MQLGTRIVSRFDAAWTKAQSPRTEKKTRLQDPFDYIAAEHIVSDRVLIDLFADQCPWFREVSGPNPVLLTGPRGCGKSMVFRRLSLKAILQQEVQEIAESKISGFYVSCSADLRNRLGWISTEGAAHRFRSEIIHYFNLVLTREIAQTLAAIALRPDREALFGFGKAEEMAVHAYLMKKLAVTDEQLLSLQGVTHMEHALDIIDSKMDLCYECMVRGTSARQATDSTFVSELTRFISKTITYLQDRKIAFLIDDFSVHRLPACVQVILNPIIWDRQATHIFKLSSEKYGAVGVDELSAVAEPGRELREVDCGEFYISREPGESRRFAKQMLEKRLYFAQYQGTPEQILGSSKYSDGSLGKSLRARSEKKGRKDDQYYGLETIADICSGDVSQLLEIYRRVFEEGKVTNHTTEMVPKHIQHSAIQSVSRELLDLIKSYVPYGEEMHLVAYWFGHLSRRILREGYLQKKGDQWIPNETSRIEVDQPPGQQGEELTPTQQEIMDELVRRAVFIEMEVGRSRHKFTPSLRWQLRRIYCPTFGTSLAKNTAVKWTTDEFKRFLIDPESECEAEFKKMWRNGKRPSPEPTLPFTA